MGNWSVDLVFDGQGDHKNSDLSHNWNRKTASIAIKEYYQHGDIELSLSACRKRDCDPIAVMFHEIGHMVTWPIKIRDSEAMSEVLWQIVATQIGLLLWRAYLLECKGS